MTLILPFRFKWISILIFSLGLLQIRAANFTDANWVASFGGPGFFGPDGPIPVTALAKGGSGTIYIALDNRVVKWDGQVGIVLGIANNHFNALICDDLGNLYAAGNFKTVGSLSANSIAKWDGTNWSALSSGLTNGNVLSLAFDGSGNLFVGGTFTNAGNVGATNVAKWDGHNWSQVGGGLGGGSFDDARSVAFDNAGNLYAVYLGVSVKKLVGNSWSSLTNGFHGGTINALTSDRFGSIYAAVNYTDTNNVYYPVSRWNGSSWSLLAPLPQSFEFVNSLTCDPSGNIFAAGRTGVEMWNGASWSQLGSGITNALGSVFVVLDSFGNVYFGGEFDFAGGGIVNNIAKWNGVKWSGLGNGMYDGNSPNFGQFTLATVYGDKSGNIYVGGGFEAVGGPFGNAVVKWNGNGWSPLGSGMTSGFVASFTSDTTGNLYAGGTFTLAGGIPATNVAKWNGSAWSALGSGTELGGEVIALACDSSNNLYAAGNFTTAGGVAATNVARWNGSVWSSLGVGINGFVYSLVCDSNGNLFAGGSFTMIGGVSAANIAKWNGITWAPLGSGLNDEADSLAFDSSGVLCVGGNFTSAGGISANYVAKWSGSGWSALGSGLDAGVQALAIDGSNLVVGGSLESAGGVPARGVAIWNGNEWSALGSGVGPMPVALAFDGFGNLWTVGSFTTAGTNVSTYVAEALLSKASFNLSLSKIGGGTNVVIGSGTPGNSYALDLATNLAPPVNWTPQTTNMLTGTIMNFTNVTSSPQGFYRTRFVQ